MKRECIVSGFGIIVADRAHVFVGNYFQSENDDYLRITNASVVRRWGTTKGLGELVKSGPTANTVLDPTNTPVYLNNSKVLFILDVDPALFG
jgi:hypothetical protein